jgi:hypothetical protein
MKKFVLVDGYISLNNEQIFIDINKTKKDIKQRGGWLSIFLTLIGISVFHNLKNEVYFEKTFHYFDFGLRILGGITIIGIFYYLFFLRKSKKNLVINEITKIEIDKLEFETELTLVFLNKREFDINFRNLESQLAPFLEEIKKRNSRIKIEYLDS